MTVTTFIDVNRRSRPSYIFLFFLLEHAETTSFLSPSLTQLLHIFNWLSLPPFVPFTSVPSLFTHPSTHNEPKQIKQAYPHPQDNYLPAMKLTPAIISSQAAGIDLQQLKDLNLSKKEINHIEDISICVNLHKLILSHNNLASTDSIAGLQHLQSLTLLNLSGNQLDSFEGVQRLKTLFGKAFLSLQYSSAPEGGCIILSIYLNIIVFFFFSFGQS